MKKLPDVKIIPMGITRDPTQQGNAILRAMELCPHTMMLTELVRNGMQAPQVEEGTPSRTVITTRRVGFDLFDDDPRIARNKNYREVRPGYFLVPKLAIWNTAKGFDPEKLRRVAGVIYNTEDKLQGINGSFGMGGRVSTAKKNLLGVRYRSCLNGEVIETRVVTREDEDGFLNETGLQEFFPDSPSYKDVFDCTDDVDEDAERDREDGYHYRAKLYDRSIDWVEVTLFGMEPIQDTTTNPYGTEDMGRWIPEYLWERWYDRKGSILEVDSDFYSPSAIGAKYKVEPDFLRFRTISESDFFGECTEKLLPTGVKLHFYRDDTSTKRHGQKYGQHEAMFAIAYKGELYHVHRSKRYGDGNWIRLAADFGIFHPSVARNLSLIVELPDNYAVFPTDYRDTLKMHGSRKTLTHEPFIGWIKDNFPTWLHEMIAAASTLDKDLDKRIYQQVEKMIEKHRKINEAGLIIETPIFHPQGRRVGPSNSSGSGMPSSGISRNPPTPLNQNRAPRPVVENIKPPAYEILKDENDIRDHELTDFIARYNSQSNTVLINENHPRFKEIAREIILDKYADQSRLFLGRLMVAIDPYAKEVIILNIIEHIVRAKLLRSNQGIYKTWEDAVSPVALTVMSYNTYMPERLLRKVVQCPNMRRIKQDYEASMGMPRAADTLETVISLDKDSTSEEVESGLVEM